MNDKFLHSNCLPACSVVAVIAILYGPIPTTVLAAILQTYVVNGRTESRVRLEVVVERWNFTPVLTSVTLTT